MRETGKTTPQRFRNGRVLFGITPDVSLIDDRPVPRNRVPPRLTSPVEIVINDDTFWNERGAIPFIKSEVILGLKFVPENRWIPLHAADVGMGVRIQYELIGIKSMPGVRLIRSVNAVSVYGFGPDVGNVTVPDLIRVFRKFNPAQLSLPMLVEKAQLYFCGIG
jgi:hypothetical protein